MKLSQKIRYGVACLFELSRHPGEYIDTKTITKTQKIPCAFAHKILQQLARGGLILAHKGLGYKLARPLQNITAAEAIEILDAEAQPDTADRSIGALLENRIHRELSNFTLSEVCC